MRLALIISLLFFSVFSYSQDSFLNYKKSIELMLKAKQFVKAKDNFNEMLMLCDNVKYKNDIATLRSKLLLNSDIGVITKDNLDESFKYDNPKLYKNTIGALYEKSQAYSVVPMQERVFTKETKSRLNEKISNGEFSSYKFLGNRDEFLVEKNGFYGLLDTKLNVLLPIEYKKIIPAYSFLKLTNKDGKQSYYSWEEKRIILPFLKSVSDIYYEDKGGVVVGYGEVYNDQALYNLSGKPILDFTGKGDQMFSVYDGKNLIGIYTNAPKTARYIDFLGKEVISKFDWISSPDENGNFVVSKEGSKGLRDRNNKILIPIEYKDIYPWAGFYKIENSNNMGIMDENLNWILPLEYNSISVLPYNVFIAENKAGKYGLFDKFKYKIIDFKYDKIENFISQRSLYDFLKFEEKKKIGLIDLKGKVVFPAKYDQINVADEKNGLLLVSLNQKYGVINIKGKEVVPLIYDDFVNNYSDNGNLIMKLNGKEIVFTKEGKLILK